MPNIASKTHLYPPPTGAYKVIINGKSAWRDSRIARLQISIGNPKQDGAKLAAMTEWAAARFDTVIFIVSDSLQRHNIALREGISLDAAHGLALTQGQQWMMRNKEAIEVAPQRIVTVWDDWLSHPDYAVTRREIDALHAQSAPLQAAVAAKARQFCKSEDPAALQTSTEFLLEEIAAIGIMLKTPAADFYAGTWMVEIFSALASLPSSDLLCGFQSVNFTEVDFVRNKAIYR